LIRNQQFTSIDAVLPIFRKAEHDRAIADFAEATRLDAKVPSPSLFGDDDANSLELFLSGITGARQKSMKR
jgi:hypothetical protein